MITKSEPIWTAWDALGPDLAQKACDTASPHQAWPSLAPQPNLHDLVVYLRSRLWHQGPLKTSLGYTTQQGVPLHLLKTTGGYGDRCWSWNFDQQILGFVPRHHDPIQDFHAAQDPQSLIDRDLLILAVQQYLAHHPPGPWYLSKRRLPNGHPLPPLLIHHHSRTCLDIPPDLANFFEAVSQRYAYADTFLTFWGSKVSLDIPRPQSAHERLHILQTPAPPIDKILQRLLYKHP